MSCEHHKVANETRYYVKRLMIAMLFAQMQKEDPTLNLSCDWTEEVKKILKEVDDDDDL